MKLRPRRARIEAVASCQLRCPSCPTTTGAIRPAITNGYLRAADFQRFIDANPEIRHIELSNYGEMFLNPELLAIMECAHRKQVSLSADNGVNLNTASPEVLEGLVRYRFRSMTCSIDGASQETYSVYRIRGDFERVLHHLREINRHKAEQRSEYPALTWQFIAFGHNEHEIPAARRLARELGMQFRLKLSWDEDISPLHHPERVRDEVSVATRNEYRERYGQDYMRGICHQLWVNPQLNWDGTLLGCCRNFWGTFGGNGFHDGLAASVNNPTIAYARQMLLGHKPQRDDIPCTTCDLYKELRADGRWLTLDEIYGASRWIRWRHAVLGLPGLRAIERWARRAGARAAEARAGSVG